MNRITGGTGIGWMWLFASLVLFLPGCSGGGNTGHWNPAAVISPTVTAVVPAPSAVGVALNTRLTATFSKEMDAVSVNAVTFTLVNNLGTPVSGTVAYDSPSKVATFTPDTNLAASTVFTATVTTGVKDVAGNSMLANYAWSFTTGVATDTAAPRVIATNIRHTDTNVSINTLVGATLSEPMDPLTINITSFTLTSGLTTVAGRVTANGANAVFTPDTYLAPNTAYMARLTTAAKDLAGNPMVADSTWTFTTGAGLDTTPPTVNSVIPIAGATGVSIGIKSISATFSEPMDPATLTNLTMTMMDSTGVNVPGTLAYDLILLSNIATFRPTDTLLANMRYTVTISTAVTDLARNAMAAPFSWSFTTGSAADTTAPRVISHINKNGDTNVSVSTNLGVTFSEPMDPLTITAATFTCTRVGGTVTGVISYSGVNAVLDPDTDLLPSTLYTVRITTGAKDLAGNSLATDSTWSFTTGLLADTIAPRVNSVIPVDGASGVSTNLDVISATFSEAMNPATITTATFSVKDSTGVAVPGTMVYDLILLSNIATFSPTGDLYPNSQYTATITTAVKDLSGNPLDTSFIWRFTTGAAPDSIPPRVIAHVNNHGDTGVPINTQIGVTFSEQMNPLTLTTTTFKLTTAGVPVAGSVTYAGVNAVFDPDNDLAVSTLYTVTVTTGAKDIAGNSIVTDTSWSWTTGTSTDTTAPRVILVNPGRDTTNVPINKSVSATFNEPMDPATITVLTYTLKETLTDSLVAGTIIYDQILLSNIATFNPTDNLKPNTQYTATLTTGVKDLNRNALATDSTWNFTTGTDTAAGAMPLNAAAPYGGIGGGAGITNEGILTVINGDLGTTGASTLVVAFYDAFANYGAPDGKVNGRIYTDLPAPGTATSMAIATAARAAAQQAWVNLSPANMPGGANVGNNLGGLTLAPGIYQAPGGTFAITGSDLTLDAQGDPDATFVFQAGSSLTVGAAGAPRSVILINGAQAANVFWQVGTAATINAAGGGTMVGTIIADAGVTFSTSGVAVITTLNGRALGLNAAVTMVNTVINVPGF